MRSFINQHRERFGVEPICKPLRVAPSAYWRQAARQRNPSLHSARARRDEFLIPHIQRVWLANFQQDLRKTHIEGGIFELLDEVIVE